jgi:hypothetical protein
LPTRHSKSAARHVDSVGCIVQGILADRARIQLPGLPELLILVIHGLQAGRRSIGLRLRHVQVLPARLRL